MKNAFIIHGFNGDTTYTFGPWLTTQLLNRGYNVYMPNFPIRDKASYHGWSSILNNYLDYFDKETIVICHSIGNPFIIKYIFENKLKINLYISVAGFCKLFTVPDRPDLNNAFIDFKVFDEEINYCKLNIKKIYSLYSDNDHVIPFEILQDFVEKLNSTPCFIHGVGHMGNRDNISSIPQIVEILNSL